MKNLFVFPAMLLPLFSAAFCAIAAPPAALVDDPQAPIHDKDAVFAAPVAATGPPPTLSELGIKKTNYPVPASNVFFVAPNGDASASGTDKNKPTTVAHALEGAPMGATLVFKGGEYRNVDGLRIRRRVTMQPYPGETVWIKGSDVVTGWQKDADTPRWSVAWDKKFTFKGSAKALNPQFPLAADFDMVFVNGKPLKQVASLADLTNADAFFVDTNAKRLLVTTDPTNKTVEVTARAFAFDTVGQDKAANGTLIRGLGIAHFAEMGMRFIGPDCLLENNTVAWNGQAGVRMNGPGHSVRGCTFACNGQVGFQGMFCNNLLLENNRFAFNNIEHFANTWGAAGAKTAVAKDMVIRNNVFERNYSAGFWMDISCMRATVVHNTTRFNDGLGLFNELGHEGIIAFNVCQENAVGIMLADTSSVRVWNNTLIGNNKSIVVKDSPRVNDGVAEPNNFYTFKKADMEAGARWVTRDNEIKNNLMVGGGRAGNKSAFLDATNAAGSDTSNQMIRSLGNNLYVRLPQQSQPAILVKWDVGKAAPTDFTSLSAFQAAYPGYEARSVVCEQALSDVFVKPAMGDYHLKASGAMTQTGEIMSPDIAAAALDAGVLLGNSPYPFVGALPSAIMPVKGVKK